MNMRDYVDARAGHGSWDRMHDMIDVGSVGGWTLPLVDVDGVSVHVFPGSNREVTLDAVQNEIRAAIGRIVLGDFDES